ncbi:MAG: hypothetical protein JRN52_00520 [Nitrososphaerota archaeon]|nr:hypothetical protein [Nitrososphaerota archaeon]
MSDETGFYLGRCKELPNAFTVARSIDELRTRMGKVIDLILDDIEGEHVKNPERVIEVVT